MPVERQRPDRNRHWGVPHGKPGFTNMLCPTENKLMRFEFLPDNRLECTGCGLRIHRDDTV